MDAHLVVGDDGSRVSAAAVAWAADEAVRRGVALTIVGCYSLPAGHGADLSGSDELDATRRATEHRLARIADRVGARRPELPIVTKAAGGVAGHLLVEEAADAELLVIGSSGTGDAPNYALGSVAATAISKSTSPVALVANSRRLPRPPKVLVINEDAAAEGADAARREAEVLGGRVHMLSLERTDFLAVVDAIHHADLVVLGIRRSRGAPEPGTPMANAVIAHASCPVVVVDARRMAPDRPSAGHAHEGLIVDDVLEQSFAPPASASSPTGDPEQLEELAEGVVHERLRAARVARIGFSDGDQPVIVPVNVATDEEGRLLFRTRSAGPLARLDGQRVAMEIDGYDVDRRRGWSILVRGLARDITEATDPTAQRLRAVSVDCWAAGRRDRVFTVLSESITSRQVQDRVDGDWFSGIPNS